ncbi:hypothetical protein [Rheinheimera sp.]|uniref:hypothetical protein n=1 Tax=Rheinheimera sp. TaxID=1869214 RepID=UPI0040476E63
MKKMADTPWSGEKVGGFFRALAWVFVLCATVAFSSVLYALYKEGFHGVAQIDGSMFGAVIAFYLFLVFLKVAVTGHAPQGWIPWR